MSSQIHDLGYRTYSGERAGVGWAVRSLALHSVRRALGLKRSAKHKIVPVITIGLAFLPAILMVGLSAFLPDIGQSDLVSYGDYYGFTSFALLLFTAASAPGVLTTDRTSGMFAMYLASPLTRSTYVLAKAIGLFTVMLLVTVCPIIFLVIAYTLVGAGPGGFVDFVETFARALVAGTVTAAALTGFGMFVSSIPKRWGIASVSIVGGLLVPTVVAAILTEEADGPDWIALFSVGDVLSKAWQHLLDDVTNNGVAIDRLGSTAVVLVAIVYAFAFLGITWWRYQIVKADR